MIRELLKSKHTFATPIVLFLFHDLGMNALNFEPETIGDRLRSIEPGIDRALIDRVNAALGLYTSDLFWTDPVTFGVVCRSLNKHKFALTSEPSIDDICWGVSEAHLLTNDTIDGAQGFVFNESIIKYVKYTLKLNAIYTAPSSIKQYFGDVSYNFVVDDPAIAEARQQEFDSVAAKLDSVVANKMYTLLTQIKQSGVPLSLTAEQDIDQLLKGRTSNDKDT